VTKVSYIPLTGSSQLVGNPPNALMARGASNDPGGVVTVEDVGDDRARIGQQRLMAGAQPKRLSGASSDKPGDTGDGVG
jgi:hypothetical protein